MRDADPETATPVVMRRAVDMLSLMLADGTIAPATHETGAICLVQFRAGALDPFAADATLEKR